MWIWVKLVASLYDPEYITLISPIFTFLTSKPEGVTSAEQVKDEGIFVFKEQKQQQQQQQR